MASSADVIESLGIQITSNASGANKSINSLNKNLERLIKNLTTVQGKNVGKTIGAVGTQAQNTSNSINSASKSLDNFGKSTGNSKSKITSLASAFGKFYATFFLVIRGIKSLGKAIETSMDYVETYNYFNVTMDKIGKQWSKDYNQWGYDTAEAYAESFQDRIEQLNKKMTGYELGEQGEATYTGAKNLGLDVETMMNYQASIGAVTNSLGLMGEVSVNTQKAMSMLAADLSSFKNIDLSSVMTNLQSGLIGQSRALYKYGIDITNATMQTYAYELGLSKAVSEMSQAEKMQLRVLMILNQSKVAWGDQANTLNSVANQYRILKQQFGNLARTIGNLFLPIVEMVLPVVNGLVIAMNQLLQSFGISLWGENWLTDIMTGTSAGYTGDDTFAGINEDIDDTNEKLDKASKNAKKLKNNLIGIDKLNIISPQQDAGTGNGTGTGSGNEIDLSNQIAGAVADYEKVWNKAFENSENLAQKYAKKILKTFKKGDWKNVGANLGSWLASGIENWDVEKFASSISKFISAVLEFLTGLLDSIKDDEIFYTIGQKIVDFICGIDWGNLVYDVGGLLASLINALAFSAVDLPAGIAQGIANKVASAVAGQDVEFELPEWLINIPKIVTGIVNPVYGIAYLVDDWDNLTAWYENTAVPWFNEKFAKIPELAKKLIGDGFSKFTEWLGIPNIKTWFSENIATPLVSNFESTKQRISEIFDGLWILVRAVWTKVSNWFDENVIQPVVSNFETAKEDISGFFEEAWTKIKEVWNKVSTWFNENVAKPLEETFEPIWEGIEKGATSAVNTVLGVVENFVNFLIDGVNELLKGFNKLVSWGADVIGEDWDGVELIAHVSIPKIPEYETGGFPEDGLFFSNHNELVGKFANGKTAVANNAQITAGIEEASYRGFMRALAQNNSQGGEQTIIVQSILDGKQIAESTNRYNARSGRRQIGYNSGY